MASFVARETDWLGRVIGLVVFLVGIGLLIAVFVMANRELAGTPIQAGSPIDWSTMGATLLMRLGRLFLLGFVASWIAGRGAQLYAASNVLSPPRSSVVYPSHPGDGGAGL
jgi:hypothetical protein